MSKVDKKQNNKTIKIKFEKFFGNLRLSQKLCKLLKIKYNVNNKFDLNNTIKNLHKYKKHLNNKEINYINKNLSKYI